MSQKESDFLNEVTEILPEAEKRLAKEYRGDHPPTDREKFILAEKMVEEHHRHDITPELANAVRGLLKIRKPSNK